MSAAREERVEEYYHCGARELAELLVDAETKLGAIDRLRSELEENTGVIRALRRQRDTAESESDALHAQLFKAGADYAALENRAVNKITDVEAKHDALAASHNALSEENERLTAEREAAEDAAHGLRQKVRRLQVENMLMRMTIAGLAHAYPQEGVTP